MKRRNLISNAFLSTATIGGLVACQTTKNQATSQSSLPTVRWRMATSWPKSLDTIFGGVEKFCNRLKEVTGGKFTITPYAAGELVPSLQVLDAVQQGTTQCGHTASYYYIGKNPALAFGTSLPFGLTAQQQNAWFYHGGGVAAMHKVYADFNVLSFPAGSTGAQMGGWFKQQISTVSNLQGLKMRIPGLGGEVMSRLGVNVQVLPGSEIYLALDRGAIDAAEWVGPYDDEKLGLNRAAKYYYYPGWWEPGTTLSFYVNKPGAALEIQINKTEWDKLPVEYQGAIQAIAKEVNLDMLAQYDTVNGAAMQRLIASGTQLVPYSLEILQAAEKIAFELYEEKASQSSAFKEIYEPWKQFRQQIYQWNKINELSFANFVMNQGDKP